MQPRDLFLTDVDGTLARIEDAASREIPDFDEIFRALHTFKGSATAFGFTGMAKYAHSLEALVLKLKSGAISWDDGTRRFFTTAAGNLRAALAVSRVGTGAVNFDARVRESLDYLREKLTPVPRARYALCVRVGNVEYLIPAESVLEVIHSPEILPISGSFLSTFEHSGNVRQAKLVRFANRLMPLLSPDALLQEGAGASAAPVAKPSIPWAVILWDPRGDERLNARFCLPVDEVVEVRELAPMQGPDREGTQTISLDRIREAVSQIAS